MAGWGKRLFGRGDKKQPTERTPERTLRRIDGGNPQPDRDVPFYSARQERCTPATDAYFESMNQMRTAIAEHDYEQAARLVRENIAAVPGWITEWTQEHGELPPSMPVFQQGGTILALVGDHEGLSRMADIAKSTPQLEMWVEGIEDHLYNMALFESIQEAVRSNPNCLQRDVKGLVGEQDGRRVANLISYLEKAGKIKRVKEGRTYRLLPARCEWCSRCETTGTSGIASDRQNPAQNCANLTSNSLNTCRCLGPQIVGTRRRCPGGERLQLRSTVISGLSMPIGRLPRSRAFLCPNAQTPHSESYIPTILAC